MKRASILFLIFCCLGLAGCAKSASLNGTYTAYGDTGDNPDYLKFHNGKYTTNLFLDWPKSSEYTLKEGSAIELHKDGEELWKWEIGNLYESYIVRSFTGDINEEIISSSKDPDSLETVQQRYVFSNGKYAFYVTNQKMNDYLISEGTYETKDNLVICAGENIDETIFLLADDKIYQILFEKH